MKHWTGMAVRSALALGLVVSLGLAGCGGDDDDNDKPAAGSGGVSGGASGSSGSGGSSTSGSGGRSGSGGGGFMFPMMMPVSCNGTPCMRPGMSLLQPCCVTGTMECGGGLMGECQVWNAPGTADPTCPAHMTMTSMLPGCCKANNQCGVMSGQGLGCIERPQLAMYAGGPLDAITCGTMMPTMPGDDAGM
jgi:hypothetical protein